MTIENDDLIEFDTVDQVALDRALALTLAEDDRTEQIKIFLAECGWYYAASFCASHQQSKNLSLKPWEIAPISVDPDEVDAIIAAGSAAGDVRNEFAAATLLQRMLASGLSQFDPTPLASLAAKRR